MYDTTWSRLQVQLQRALGCNKQISLHQHQGTTKTSVTAINRLQQAIYFPFFYSLQAGSSVKCFFWNFKNTSLKFRWHAVKIYTIFPLALHYIIATKIATKEKNTAYNCSLGSCFKCYWSLFHVISVSRNSVREDKKREIYVASFEAIFKPIWQEQRPLPFPASPPYFRFKYISLTNISVGWNCCPMFQKSCIRIDGLMRSLPRGQKPWGGH